VDQQRDDVRAVLITKWVCCIEVTVSVVLEAGQVGVRVAGLRIGDDRCLGEAGTQCDVAVGQGQVEFGDSSLCKHLGGRLATHGGSGIRGVENQHVESVGGPGGRVA
jgi:hypothetical protein